MRNQIIPCSTAAVAAATQVHNSTRGLSLDTTSANKCYVYVYENGYTTFTQFSLDCN